MEALLLVILAVGFAAAGMTKLAGVAGTRENFDRWVVPGWTRPLVGVVELVIAVLAVYGLGGSEGAQQFAALMALWLMVGAIVVHGMAGDPVPQVVPAIVLLLSAVGLLAIQQT